MELSKKTTILLSEEMHRRLAQLARQRRTSLGGLIRDAVATCYGLHDPQSRIAAVEELAALDLPVDDVERLVEESVPEPQELP